MLWKVILVAYVEVAQKRVVISQNLICQIQRRYYAILDHCVNRGGHYKWQNSSQMFKFSI